MPRPLLPYSLPEGGLLHITSLGSMARAAVKRCLVREIGTQKVGKLFLIQ